MLTVVGAAMTTLN